jgi:hypothetical protein
VAFGCGAIGSVLAVAMALLIAHRMNAACTTGFAQAWEGSGREVYNEAFRDAVLEECGRTDVSDCSRRLESRWLSEERDVHTLTYTLAATEACPVETEDGFEIDFEPGALVKLGVEDELPEKVVVPDTQPEPDAAAEATVTDDADAQPIVEPPRPADTTERPPPKNPPRDRPDDAPISKLPTDPTPFDDPPTTTVRKGDPFGDPDGWSELAEDGNPWATAVTRALNGMQVGAFAARMEGTAKFQITLCKDGSVKQVRKKGGSLDADGQARVANAVRSLKLPKPPPSVAAKMTSRCAKLKYTFIWSSGVVK